MPIKCLPLLVLGVVVAASNIGCSHDGEPAEEQADGAPPPIVPVVPAPPPRVPDAGAPDARAEQELLAIADAGRSCGSKDLPDCPLQLWMKQNATTMLEFGEITTLAEDFDQIALFAPPHFGRASRFPYWASISRDGAAATRMGDLDAAKAACRGCHSQYLATYHASLRGLPLPPLTPRHVPQ
jgi:hypothetical protein